MPVEMDRPQAVVMGGKVYVGGGSTMYSPDEFRNQVFQYDPSRDEWSCLPPLKVIFFAMAQFEGDLITVGGWIPYNGVTGKVYRLEEESQKWEEFITPMPTARYCASVATTHSAIVASGGATGVRDPGFSVLCATVEVYNSITDKWYTADLLPVPCAEMASVIIEDTWYLLGGDFRGCQVLHTPLTTLVQKTISSAHQPARCLSARKKVTCKFTSPVWKTLPDPPLLGSAAASLSGSLLAVGGYEFKAGKASQKFHIFSPNTNSWASLGSLPEPRFACTTVHLSSNQVLVVGGRDNQTEHTKTVVLGTITS